MKIISKFKDYYDYYQGIYGMDAKLTLDRTEFYKQTFEPSDYSVHRFWVCGWLVEGMYLKGQYYYGEDIENLDLIDNPRKLKFRPHLIHYYEVKTPKSFRYNIDILKYPLQFKDVPRNLDYFKPIVKIECPNDKLECPILYKSVFGNDVFDSSLFSKFPILSDFQFYKVFTDFQMWTMLTEWLGREKKIENNQTNNEKILSNGFDLKTSFRHPVK